MMNPFPLFFILLSAQLSILAHDHLAGQPFGIKMCEQEVNQISGIKSFKFQLVHLSCHFCDEVCQYKVSRTEKGFCKNSENINEACLQWFKIIKTRKNSTRCMKVFDAPEREMKTFVKNKPNRGRSAKVTMHLYGHSLPMSKADNSSSRKFVYGIYNTKIFYLSQITRTGKQGSTSKEIAKQTIMKMVYFKYGYVLYGTTDKLIMRSLSKSKEKILIRSILVLDISRDENGVAYVLLKNNRKRDGTNCTWCIWTVVSPKNVSLFGFVSEPVSQIAVSGCSSRIFLSNKSGYILTIKVKLNHISLITTCTKFPVQTLMIDRTNDVLYYASDKKIIRFVTDETVFEIGKTICSLHFFQDTILILRKRGRKIRKCSTLEVLKHVDMKGTSYRFQFLMLAKNLFLS